MSKKNFPLNVLVYPEKGDHYHTNLNCEILDHHYRVEHFEIIKKLKRYKLCPACELQKDIHIDV